MPYYLDYGAAALILWLCATNTSWELERVEVFLLCVTVLAVSFAMRSRVHKNAIPRLQTANLTIWWIACAVVTVVFFLSTTEYSKAESKAALAFLTGVTLGNGSYVWVLFNDTMRKTLFLLCVLIVCLLVNFYESGIDSGSVALFHYRDQVRWTGTFKDPNTFGILMGVALVLAIGQAVFSLKSKGPGDSTGEGGWRKAELWRLGKGVLFVVAAVTCGLGMIKSYSRGAWLGAACGLAFIGYQVVRRQVSGAAKTGSRKQKAEISCGSWLNRNGLAVAVLAASLVVVGYWNYRHTEGTVVRRAFSASQANDFSWRNRVAAWTGSLQMMAEKPVPGLGWNLSERVYEQFYHAPKVDEGAAIQLNDYFTLGTTLGIPALFCFVAFVGLSLMRSAECGMRNKKTETHTSPRPSPQRGEGVSSPVTRQPSLPLVCHSAAIVLLVGFWFDGGLFKLATSSMFWILLALGSVEQPPPATARQVGGS